MVLAQLKPHLSQPFIDIYLGDVREVLKQLPEESVQCVVTSPPYWGLRDYGTTPIVFGGNPECAHDWSSSPTETEVGKGNWAQATNGRGEVQGSTDEFRKPIRSTIDTGFCKLCGAWRGHLGLELTPQQYLDNMVDVFREVRRVLRKDGTVWLNIGDSYAGSWGAQSRSNTTREDKATLKGSSPISARQIMEHPQFGSDTGSMKRTPGLKPKDLVGMPWRLAFALQADGWWLRSDIIWHKRNVIPESVRDRPTKCHEYIFLLAKSRHYFYDREAIKEDMTDPANSRDSTCARRDVPPGSAADSGFQGGRNFTDRNKRSVWSLSSQPFPDAHFATFPEELIRPCILAGTSAVGACPQCGAPRERILDETFAPQKDVRDPKKLAKSSNKGLDESNGWGETPRGTVETKTIGWRKTCECKAAKLRPCVVLDPFMGSGTTALVARENGCQAIGIELNPDYIEIARKRLRQDVLPFAGDGS